MTQTIEQLTARVRELEKENARLKCRHSDAWEQLAASQLHAEQLREALNQWIDIAANCSIQSGCCCCGDSMENHASPMLCGHSPVDMADSVVHSAIQQTDNAIAIPHSTSALDAYVAEKVKEAMKKSFDFEMDSLVRQRDLAVEALEAIAGRRIFIDNLASNVDIAVMTLNAIKESEGK